MDLLSVQLLKKIIYQETKSLNMQLKVEVKHEIIRTFTPYIHVLEYIYMYPDFNQLQRLL